MAVRPSYEILFSNYIFLIMRKHYFSLKWTSGHIYLQPTGATVSLNETYIVVQEGDNSNTTVDICVVLANAMGGLRRNVVIDVAVMPDNANSKSPSVLARVVQLVKMNLYFVVHDV